MLNLEKTKSGDIIWRACIQFSRTRKRAIRYSPPSKYIFVEYVNESLTISKIKDIATGIVYRVYTTELYNTKEDADEEWNRIIYDTLDYVQHEYEARRKYIKKFLTNYGRKV